MLISCQFFLSNFVWDLRGSTTIAAPERSGASEPIKQKKPERTDKDDDEEIYQEQEHLRPTIYRSVRAPFASIAMLWDMETQQKTFSPGDSTLGRGRVSCLDVCCHASASAPDRRRSVPCPY